MRFSHPIGQPPCDERCWTRVGNGGWLRTKSLDESCQRDDHRWTIQCQEER